MHNVLISDSQEVYLLDNESLRYLPLSIDFFKLQYHFFQDDAEMTARWQEAYLSYLSEDEVKEFNSSKNFFNSYVVLDFAQQEAYTLSQLKDKTAHYEPYPLSLERAQDLMEEIEQVFKRFGYQMPENNRRQAFVPSGSHAISNPVGTAPAFITEVGGKPIVCLPGVPRELKFLLKTEVLHWLERRFDISKHRLIYRVLKVVGLGESRVDQLIGDLIRTGQNPEVGLLASQGEIKVRIAARTGSDSEARALIGPIEKEIRSRLGTSIFGQDSDTLEGIIGSLLTKKDLTLSTFETFTGGLAAQRLHHFPPSRISKSTVILTCLPSFNTKANPA